MSARVGSLAPRLAVAARGDADDQRRARRPWASARARRVALVALGVVACGGASAPEAASPGTRLVHTSAFGSVAVRFARDPVAVVLLVGAEPDVVPAEGVAVPLGYDGWLRREQLGERCWFPAGQLMATADEVKARLDLPARTPVWLVGQGVAGAPVAVLVALQAPPDTFAGVVAVGFTPALAGGRAACAVDPARWTRVDGATPSTPLWMVRPRPGGEDWVEAQPWARRAPDVTLSRWWSGAPSR